MKLTVFLRKERTLSGTWHIWLEPLDENTEYTIDSYGEKQY